MHTFKIQYIVLSGLSSPWWEKGGSKQALLGCKRRREGGSNTPLDFLNSASRFSYLTRAQMVYCRAAQLLSPQGPHHGNHGSLSYALHNCFLSPPPPHRHPLFPPPHGAPSPPPLHCAGVIPPPAHDLSSAPHAAYHTAPSPRAETGSGSWRKEGEPRSLSCVAAGAMGT